MKTPKSKFDFFEKTSIFGRKKKSRSEQSRPTTSTGGLAPSFFKLNWGRKVQHFDKVMADQSCGKKWARPPRLPMSTGTQVGTPSPCCWSRAFLAGTFFPLKKHGFGQKQRPVWLRHTGKVCGRRAPGAGRAGAGRFAESLWPLPPHPHTHTHTRKTAIPRCGRKMLPRL